MSKKKVQSPEQRAQSQNNPQSAIPNPQSEDVPKHRQCPICFAGELKGVGKAYSTHGNTTYFKCKGCGHNWSIKFTHETIELEHRYVELETRGVQSPDSGDQSKEKP